MDRVKHFEEWLADVVAIEIRRIQTNTEQQEQD